MTTPRRDTPRYTLRSYVGLPRSLRRDMLALVNRGYTPEEWKAEQARLKRAQAKLEASEKAARLVERPVAQA